MTPPARARKGKTCPGLRKDDGFAAGDASVRHVSARSCAEIPVVTDESEASIETVYAVRCDSVLSSTIWGSSRSSVMEEAIGAQIRPLHLISDWNRWRDGKELLDLV